MDNAFESEKISESAAEDVVVPDKVAAAPHRIRSIAKLKIVGFFQTRSFSKKEMVGLRSKKGLRPYLSLRSPMKGFKRNSVKPTVEVQTDILLAASAAPPAHIGITNCGL